MLNTYFHRITFSACYLLLSRRHFMLTFHAQMMSEKVNDERESIFNTWLMRKSYLTSGTSFIKRSKTFNGNQETKKTTAIELIITFVRRRFSTFSACMLWNISYSFLISKWSVHSKWKKDNLYLIELFTYLWTIFQFDINRNVERKDK